MMGEEQVQLSALGTELTNLTELAPKMAEYRKDAVDPTVADHGKNKKSKSEQPLLEKFKQQSLPAMRPIFTAVRLSLFLLVIGVVFVPIGASVWIFQERIREINVPYTDCLNILSEDLNVPCSDVMGDVSSPLTKSCKCLIGFNLTEELVGNVNVYYSLTNFYQNHRKYLNSRDESQLRGKVGTAEDPEEPSRDCAPYDYEDEETNGTRRIYFPCGAIANSMFSDSIRLFYNPQNGTRRIEVPLNKTGIAWASDKKHKFENPPWFSNYSTDLQLQRVFAKPKYWRKNLWELDPDNPDNNGLKNEDLIVWMRVAALPNFRKLFRKVNRFDSKRPEFANGMPAGKYEMEVDYNFPVKMIDGTKTIVFSETSVLGSSGSFLGVAYVITGCVCVLLGVFLLLVHVNTSVKSHKFTSQKAKSY